MPNYEYQCSECAHRFEIWQSVGEAAPTCPDCGAATKKVFHPPRVIFKGSGFYVTDLRAEKEAKSSAKKDANGAATTADTASGADGGKGSEATSDGSSATKAESKAETTTPSQAAASDKK